MKGIRRREEGRERIDSVMFDVSCFILMRPRPYWVEELRLRAVTVDLAHSPFDESGEQPRPRCQFRRYRYY